MKLIYKLLYISFCICSLTANGLVAQTKHVILLTDTCRRIVSSLEDPTSGQIAGGVAPAVISQFSWVRPAESTYRVAFSGVDGSGASHEGVDYVNDDQMNAIVYVRAATSGKVVYVREGCEQSSMFSHNNTARESGAGWGNHIVLSHKDQIYTRYAHLLKGSVLVNNGDSVKAGQIIATMGNSGRSELRHMHFELGTKAGSFAPCSMSQNFDKVYNPEQINYSTLNNQITLTSPVNNKDSVSMNAVLIWEKEVTSAMYTVEIASDITFNQVLHSSILNDNYFKLAALSPGTYFWRVKSDKLNYSPVWSFKLTALENFENCLKNGLPTSWGRFAEIVTKGTISNDLAWLVTDIDKKNSGKFSARMGNYMSVSDCWMISPKFPVTGASKELTFNRATTSGDYGSSLEIYVSENPSQPNASITFTKIKTISEGVDALWHTETLDLTSYIGKSIFVGFKVHNFGDPANVNAGGDNWWIDDVSLPIVSISSSIPSTEMMRMETSVFPNPLKKYAQINLNLKGKSFVSIDVLDISGKMVQKIVSALLPAGAHTFHWKCGEDKVKIFPNGLYVVRIRTDKETSLIKVIKIE